MKKTEDILKPYGYTVKDNRLILVLQDAGNETQEMQWGQLTLHLTAFSSKFSQQLPPEKTVALIAPAAMTLRQIQNLLCCYFQLLHAGRVEDAEQLIGSLNGNINAFAKQVSDKFGSGGLETKV